MTAPAGGVPVDPPEPERCPRCRDLPRNVLRCPDPWHLRPAAGGVVQPPADPEGEVEALAQALWEQHSEEPLSADNGYRGYFLDIAQHVHGRGWRRVPEGHRVVPDGRVWLDGRLFHVPQCVVCNGTGETGGDAYPAGMDLNGNLFFSEVRTCDLCHGAGWLVGEPVRPVGAAGREGTDGD